MINVIAQPLFRSTLDVIDQSLTNPGFQRMDVAVAYITSSGAKLLLDKMRQRSVHDKKVTKRWITSFDYCRTEPNALEVLLSLPSSSIRIHGAEICLRNKGTPRVPFHPKMFLFESQAADEALAGSGNLSRSGLRSGFEAGFSLRSERGAGAKQTPIDEAVSAMRNYFGEVWKGATPLTPALLSDYAALFERAENLQNPVPTEDDTAPSDTLQGALSERDLRKLRVCRNFWIEGGNITRNRGKNVPGNQLMMKRLSRVFFGFEPISVPENSPIGTVSIRYGEAVRDDCSLTYSDNKMDKLVLPIPGDGGPASYDNETLMFRRTSPGNFNLTLGSQSDIKGWKKKSHQIDASFTMTGGREWGVF